MSLIEGYTVQETEEREEEREGEKEGGREHQVRAEAVHVESGRREETSQQESQEEDGRPNE